MSLREANSASVSVAWAASSSTAIVYDKDLHSLQQLRNLSDYPTVFEFPDFAALNGDISTLASDAYGDRAVVGLTNGSDAGLYLFSTTRPAVRISDLTAVSAAVFSPSGDTVFVADSATGAVGQAPDRLPPGVCSV